MTINRLFKIPELVLLIGLDQHDFTLCIRVCREWFDIFTPLLYHTIAVYDFDLYSHKFEGATSRSKRSAKNAHLASSDDDPGYGGRMVHKYAHLIHSITSPDIHALTYLGDQAVNLTYVSLIPCFPGLVVFRPLYADAVEQLSWYKHWESLRDRKLIVSTWVALIDGNPSLKSVHIDLNNCVSGTEQIIHALAKCGHLEEIHLESMIQADIIEMVLDHCPHILSLSASCRRRRSHTRGDHQIFKAVSMGGVGAPTKIRYLNISNTEPWIYHVLRRCPDLKTLVLPQVNMDEFPVLSQGLITLTSTKLFNLRSLTLSIDAYKTATNEGGHPAPLINSCAASLTVLSITYISSPGFGRFVIPQIDPLLWLRLEEFRYRGPNAYGPDSPSHRLCDVLALCPNLRVFELFEVMVTATDFLSTQVVCDQTLAELALTVCSDFTAQPQPPPWIMSMSPYISVMDEIHMMTQLALTTPIHNPEPQPPHVSQPINAHPTEICLYIISKFPQLKRLEYGRKLDSNNLSHPTYPLGALGEKQECVQIFQKGLPRLRTLIVRGVSY